MTQQREQYETGENEGMGVHDAINSMHPQYQTDMPMPEVKLLASVRYSKMKSNR